jgi:GT2 family glycosyltransferase
MITILITTYRQPEALELCLESIVKSQKFNNQIIVVENGFDENNKPVFKKYKKHIDILPFEENVGMNRALNLGVYNSSYDKVLIAHDDMVFPKDFDEKLLKDYQPNSVLTPNTIEPYPSMFKQFVIHDLGRNPKIFDLEKFWEFVNGVEKNIVDETGSTFPFFINKYDYLKVGGFDENYPLSGVVADWDFFLKCNLSGLKMLRTYNCNIYHFVSLSTNITEEQKENRKNNEREGYEYAIYKWGNYIKHNHDNNLKYI